MNREKFSISLNQDATWRMDKLHFHESVEVLLSLSEGGDFFIGQEMYPIRKNTLFLLDSAVLHRTVHETQETPYRRYIMHILPSTLESLSTSQTDFARSFRRAKTCTALRRYVINPDLCKGCSKCARNCPVNAISGVVKSPYTIDTTKCIKCDACRSNCAFDAIYVEA